MPCFDATATLPLTLQSLYEQTDAPPTEILVVDNRSRDDLRGLVGRWVREHEAAHVLDLRVVDAFAHQGTSYACNVGAAHARAERLVLMGGDLGITRDLFRALGGFDQSLPLAGEDNELALRLRQSGREIATSPAFRIAYRQRHVPAAIRAESRRAAAAHVLNGARYSILRRSPVVGETALIRTTLRPLRTLLRALPAPRRGDLQDVANDASLARGAWEGLWRFVIAGSPPAPRLGVGLDEGEDA